MSYKLRYPDRSNMLLKLVPLQGVVVLPDSYEGGGSEELRGDQKTVEPRSKVWTRYQTWKKF